MLLRVGSDDDGISGWLAGTDSEKMDPCQQYVVAEDRKTTICMPLLSIGGRCNLSAAGLSATCWSDHPVNPDLAAAVQDKA
jgi:hypothetical protein